MIELNSLLLNTPDAYELIFDHHPQGILISSDDGVIVHCNKATLGLLDTKKELIIGGKVEKLFSNVAWLDFLTSKVVKRVRFNSKNNTDLLIDMVIQRLDKADASIIYLTHSLDSSTDHELQESLNRFETLAELAPIGIFLVDASGHNLFVNKKWKDLSGLASEEAKGNGWIKAIYHEDLKMVQDGWSALLKENRPFDYEYRYIHNETKKVTDVHCLTVPFIDQNKRTTGYIGVVQDISAARALRSQLEVDNQILEQKVYKGGTDLLANQAKLEKACRLARLGHWEIILDHKFKVSWSNEYIELYDLNQDVDYDDPRFFLQFAHDNDKERLLNVTTEAIKNGTNALIEYRIVTGFGKEKYLKEEVQCQVNETGKVVRVFGVTQDITDLKIIEQKLLKTLEQERNLSVLKSRFVSMASHEFRTPLTTILSSAELIQFYVDKGDFKKIDNHAEKIISSLGHLTYILDDFLSLEKVESGSVQIRKDHIQIKDFVNEILEEMSLLSKSHRIIHQHTGEISILVDTHILRNIMINLLSNAIKYSSEGKSVRINSEYVDGSTLHISVIDEGLGIPEKEQKDMFRRFFRASNTGNIQGTGLGLTIVRRYLELVDGAIDFESIQNVGTTFNIHIPINEGS